MYGLLAAALAFWGLSMATSLRSRVITICFCAFFVTLAWLDKGVIGLSVFGGVGAFTYLIGLIARTRMSDRDKTWWNETLELRYFFGTDPKDKRHQLDEPEEPDKHV